MNDHRKSNSSQWTVRSIPVYLCAHESMHQFGVPICAFQSSLLMVNYQSQSLFPNELHVPHLPGESLKILTKVPSSTVGTNRDARAPTQAFKLMASSTAVWAMDPRPYETYRDSRTRTHDRMSDRTSKQMPEKHLSSIFCQIGRQKARIDAEKASQLQTCFVCRALTDANTAEMRIK